METRSNNVRYYAPKLRTCDGRCHFFVGETPSGIIALGFRAPPSGSRVHVACRQAQRGVQMRIWRDANMAARVGDVDIEAQRGGSPAVDPTTGWMISPIVAASLCITPRGLLTPRQAAKVDALKNPRISQLCVGSPCIPGYSPKQRHSETSRLAQCRATIWNLCHAALRPNGAARSSRSHQRLNGGLEQRPKRGAD